MNTFKQHIIEKSLAKSLRDLVIPKKWTHTFKLAIKAKKYKHALKLYHDMIRQYNRNPGAQSTPGALVANPKGLALAKVAQMTGISKRELEKVFDKKTRHV